MWHGTILMGGKTNMNLVFDTGSDWLVVQGKDCSSCKGNKFDPFITGKLVNGKLSTKTYGTAVLNGTVFKDIVCLDGEKCVNEFEYFLISS